MNAPDSQASKLRAIRLRNAFRLKFNMHVFTRFNVCKRVVLRLTIVRKLTGFYRLIYCISLRRLSE
jgi:hypothetical protein